MSAPEPLVWSEAGLGLGGNLGDPAAAIDAALEMLCSDDATRLRARSALYRTAPWGDEDQPPFLNACALVETRLSPQTLLARCLAVERALGRVRGTGRRWGPRAIDVDILFFNGLELERPELVLPHPRLFERAFVLVPLAEIAPDLIIAGRRVADAAASLGSEGVERVG